VLIRNKTDKRNKKHKRVKNIFTIYFGVSLSNEFEMNSSEMVRKKERKRKERKDCNLIDVVFKKF
jgi:hypothetical protein